MATKPTRLSDPLYRYLNRVSLRETELQRRLRVETATHRDAQMQIPPTEGQLLALLVRLMGAQRVLEIGTFTGYSTLSIASALQEGGHVISCDIDESHIAIARRYWQEAGVAHRIQTRLAPALDTLEELLGTGHAEGFDFAFIDADKTNYDAYYENCLLLLRPGGLLAIDNTLWDGRVIDPSIHDEKTLAIRGLNNKLRNDDRVEISMLPIADGLTLVLKR